MSLTKDASSPILPPMPFKRVPTTSDEAFGDSGVSAIHPGWQACGVSGGSARYHHPPSRALLSVRQTVCGILGGPPKTFCSLQRAEKTYSGFLMKTGSNV